MLIKFTIDSGSTPVRDQARADVLADRLKILSKYDPNAEQSARDAIRTYIKSHPEFTAAQIACTGKGDEWHPIFEPLYDALAKEFPNEREAHEEAGKFLGLLVWNEALHDSEDWHFTSYPKTDSEFMVTHYFALEGHIKVAAKLNQASTAREHGDFERASALEETAQALKSKWQK